MSKELIERLRPPNIPGEWTCVEAADLIEAQQKRIEGLEADTKEVNATRIFLRKQERLLRQLAAAQAQIKVMRDQEPVAYRYKISNCFGESVWIAAARSVATCLAVAGAVWLAYHGKEGWGWMMFLALWLCALDRFR